MSSASIRWRRLVVALVLPLALSACGPSHRDDEAAITALMKHTWDKPDLPLVVGPIALVGDAAVADWTQGANGGRALLKRNDSLWSVVLCAGDGLKSEETLRSSGLSSAQAQRITQALAAKEQVVLPERLAAMTSFKGLVRMHPSHESTDASASHDGSHHSSVQVTEAIIPAPPPGATTAAGYLTIANESAQDIVLISAETAVASAVSLHENSIEDGMARMRPLSDGLRIGAGQRTSLEAGHSHLMLEGLKRSLVSGELIPVTLHFASIGRIETTFSVKSLAELEGHGHDH